MSGKGAIFLDRDGTINQMVPGEYITDPAGFHFLPGALDALGFLSKNSERALVICTNQSCVGRGLCTETDVAMIHVWMMEGIARVCDKLPHVYVCMHTPEDGCGCRKPKPGLLLKAANDLGLDLSRSCIVGDTAIDLQAGWAAGLSEAYLVSTGDHRNKWPEQLGWGRREYEMYADLWAAAQAIVRREQGA